MEYFLNLKNGRIHVCTYRFVDAIATNRDDLIKAYENASNETLCSECEPGDEHYDDNFILSDLEHESEDDLL